MRHWKVYLTTFAVLAIAALLFIKAGGTDFNGLFSSIGDKLSGFIPQLNPTPSGNAFPIELTAGISKFQGSSFNVANVSISANSPCVFTKLPNNIDFERKGGVCTFSVDSASGKISFANGVTLDMDLVGVNMQPGSLMIGGMVVNKLSLTGVDGTLRIFQNDTWVALPLQSKNIDAYGLVGNMKIQDSSVTVNALVASIKGSGGNGPGFQWSG